MKNRVWQASGRSGSVHDERGIALLVVLMMLMIVTVIGIGFVTTTDLENRMAGYVRIGEQAQSAAEACLNTSVKVIQQTIEFGQVPLNLMGNAAPPGPVPVGNVGTLKGEIYGDNATTNYQNYPDQAEASPNIVVPAPGLTLNNFRVSGDIDILYKVGAQGGAVAFAEATSGTGTAQAADLVYRVNCMATNAATNATARVTAIYSCRMTADGCIRKI